MAFTGSGTTGSIAQAEAAGNIAFSTTAELNGAGELSASGSLSFSGAGVINATGALVSQTSINFGSTAGITGAGALSAAASITFSNAGELTSVSADDMQAAAAIEFSSTADITAIGNMQAVVSIRLSANAELGPIPEATGGGDPNGAYWSGRIYEYERKRKEYLDKLEKEFLGIKEQTEEEIRTEADNAEAISNNIDIDIEEMTQLAIELAATQKAIEKQLIRQSEQIIALEDEIALKREQEAAESERLRVEAAIRKSKALQVRYNNMIAAKIAVATYYF
jgi:hypothetical protein